MANHGLGVALLFPTPHQTQFPILVFSSMTMETQYQQQQGHICQCLSRICTIKRNSVLTIFGNRRNTGLEFVQNVQSLALGLFDLGIQPGDIVAIAALNSDLYLQWILAIAFVGGITAPLNYRWSFEEARSALVVLRPVMFVFDESCGVWYSELQNDDLSSLRWYGYLGDPFPIPKKIGSVLSTKILRKALQTSAHFDYRWAPEGVAFICFTSGTCGRPKGVAISHTAVIVQSLAKIAIVGYSEDDVYLHTAPLCHIGGISSGMAMLMVGACHVLFPKFETGSVIQAIELHHVSSLITVPAMMADLIHHSRTNKTWTRGASLKKILNGGGGLSAELIRDAAEVFPNTKLLSAYGMTETCSSLTFMTLFQPKCGNFRKDYKKIDEVRFRLNDRPGVCVGKPAPHVELRVDGNGRYPIGRILTRGPHVMLKHWNEISITELNSRNQGWFDTGDIGWIDDMGDVWLIGRFKDRIKSGGENVYPEEVEAILSQHPGISSIMVVGVPDLRLSEMVVACVRIRENWQWDGQNFHKSFPKEEHMLSGELLQKYCKERNLTRFKIPKIFILWRKPFPLTSTGKLRRDDVRREAISHVQILSSKL